MTPPEPYSYIAACATGEAVLATYLTPDGKVSLVDITDPQGDTIHLSRETLPDVITMLQDTLRALTEPVPQ